MHATGHYIAMGFVAVVLGKILAGIAKGWLGFSM